MFRKQSFFGTRKSLVLSGYLSLKKEKKVGCIIPTMNCYLRNGQLRDPDFTRRILCHPNQQQYLQHPILWVVLNISKKVLRTRLIRLMSQHPIKQVGLTIHFKTSLVRISDNIKYKAQKPCNENQSLKSTDLHQTQRFIESLSISTALVPYGLRFSQIQWYYNSNIVSKLYFTYGNHVAIPRKKHTHIQTKNNNKTNKNDNNI